MKYKYYIRKPKGAIVRDILLWVGGAGVIAVAISAPNFLPHILKVFSKQFPQANHKNTSTVFRRLLHNGSLKVERRGKQIYVSLTEIGRKRAGWFQINDLRIQVPKRWDKKWRVIIFDIPHEKRFIREVLRGFLKRLGFYQLQKSVWVHPYNCKDEIALLQDFFGLNYSELQLMIVGEMGEDTALLKHFFQ